LLCRCPVFRDFRVMLSPVDCAVCRAMIACPG
jgi:hypothetical protein